MRNVLWIPLGIALLALVLRVLFLVQLRSTPLFDSPGLDAAYYLNRAHEIADGDWIGRQIFFMGPLYPYWLALIGKLSGFSFTAIRLAQAVLGSFATVLLFLIGRRLFDLRIAALAALGLACNVIAIYYDNLLLMTTLVLFLNLALLLDLLSIGNEPRPVRLIASGALLGITALARASILLFAPAVLFWLWTRPAPDAAPRRDTGARWRRLAAYACGLVLVLGPVSARNYLVGGDLVLVTSNGGLNLFIGNNPLGKGTYMPLDQVARAAGVPAHVDVSWMVDDPTGRQVAQTALGRELSPSEVSKFFSDRTFQYVEEQPGRAIRILGRKLLLFWNATEIAQIEDPALYRELVPLMGWPLPGFGVVAPLALLGLLVGLRDWRRYLLLYLFVITYTLSIILFFVTSRYRAPITPVLLLFAAHGLVWLVEATRAAWQSGRLSGDLWRPAAAVGVLLGAGWLVHLDLIQIDRAAAYINLGIAYANDERYEEAIESFERAVSAEPGDPSARYNLAAAQLRAGRIDDAREGFRTVLRLDPRSSAARTGLARTERAAGDLAAAGIALRDALAFEPDRTDLWLELGQLELAASRTDSATAAFERATGLDPGATPAWLALTRLHIEAQRYEEALDAARHAAAGLPMHPPIHSQLGMLEAMQGNYGAAEDALRRALTLEPAYLPARLGLARLFLRSERPDSARVHLEAANAQAPGHPQVEIMLEELHRSRRGDPTSR